MGRSARLRSLPFLIVLIAGVALRACHLGSFGLWWDEIVHIWTSQSGGLADVLLEVKRGIPPGTGNAGAVPLDYVLLHLYLRAAAPPSPDALEIYYRLPSFLYSVLALPLLYAVGRRFFDRQVALVATLLLALSLPHVLYAAEARFYSLFVLTTIGNLYAFARLVERRERWSVWTAYAAVNVVYFFSGLFSLLVLLIQYAILGGLLAGALLARRRDDARASRRALAREAIAYVASATAVAGCAALYFAGTTLGHKFSRNTPDWLLDPLRLTWSTLASYSSDDPLLFGALLLLPLPLLYARRRGVLPVVLYLEASLLTIPVIVELARWKRYYFHPRHALFLLPAVEVLTAISLLVVVRALDPFRFVPPLRARRDACNLVLVCTLVVATLLPTLRTYVVSPERFFARSKKTYDVKRVTQDVRDAVAGYGPREKYLLVAQRNSMANTTLAQYLRWYGLEDRVVLRGTQDPAKTLRALARVCATGCLGQRGPVLDRALELTAAVGLTPEFQRLLGLLRPIGQWPGTVREIGVVTYGPLPQGVAVDGFSQRKLRGVQVVTVAAHGGGLAPPRAPGAP